MCARARVKVQKRKGQIEITPFFFSFFCSQNKKIKKIDLSTPQFYLVYLKCTSPKG